MLMLHFTLNLANGVCSFHSALTLLIAFYLEVQRYSWQPVPALLLIAQRWQKTHLCRAFDIFLGEVAPKLRRESQLPFPPHKNPNSRSPVLHVDVSGGDSSPAVFVRQHQVCLTRSDEGRSLAYRRNIRSPGERSRGPLWRRQECRPRQGTLFWCWAFVVAGN